MTTPNVYCRMTTQRYQPAIGTRFSRLVVEAVDGIVATCGVTHRTSVYSLRRNHTRSCGCLLREAVKTASRTHGGTDTRLHRIWGAMKSRCGNPHVPSFRNYGGRGIAVCKEWCDFVPFRDWALAHGYDDALELDRIDNDGGYGPSNCRWTTRSANQRNRPDNHRVTAFGETKCIADWVDDPRCSIAYKALVQRLARGVNPDVAIGTPRRHRWRPLGDT